MRAGYLLLPRKITGVYFFACKLKICLAAPAAIRVSLRHFSAPLVTVQAALPKNLNDKERELIQQWKK
jgi:hypothetical protein